MPNLNPGLASFMRLSPVIPVLVIDRTEDAVPLGRALVEGGLKVLEITLRTPNALEVIREIAQHVDGAVVAAGTVTTPAQWEAAAEAGAQFMVSPGLTPALIEHAQHATTGLLPGVATASELMTALDGSFTHFKFFPAQQAGGVGMLKALGGPFADALFCPTGGITVETAPQFLSLPNVACVGGSWLAPAALVKAGDWNAIRDLARAASALRAA
ncbi:keto-deoxy-phosphogluconate aldolase [Aquabacterium olei]|uniref:2-dehydro-3-deoxy-phosphogluconate aldolase n=1 Tax=Aquabacterium olei TaxID=1296669 RepID=A0A2U8FUZ1_9BURK|nr:bifunctional 4-hydroxy-2-oxoglutarate aldolase/2-dehydro-3-deoxy-phosphogluconate aldolase [Aquabacterium olei]AWI54046.1 keto-deoxy-phosphogluconate aldolase [Aquabacterium olei]